MPPASDISISADIVRIRLIRNDVNDHKQSVEFNNTTFETMWQKISKILMRLGIPQPDIDDLKVAPPCPERESYIKKLTHWKEEDQLFSMLRYFTISKRCGTFPNVYSSEVDQLAKFDFSGKIDNLCKELHSDNGQWFFDKLVHWFRDVESRVLILNARPSVGKSVLCAKVCKLYQQRGQLAAAHFYDFRYSDCRNPKRILQSLASQMCDNIEGFRQKLCEVLCREHSRESLSDTFRVLLHDPLHALGRHDTILIVIDALEKEKIQTKSSFLELMSSEFAQLPIWIKVFISSTPELQVRMKLQHLNPMEILPDGDHPIPNPNLLLVKSIKHREKLQHLETLEKEKLTKLRPPVKCFADMKCFALGKGSMGTSVYLGILEDGSEVAVKRMLKESCEDAAGNEKKIFSLIFKKKSPFIVSYRDFLIHDPCIYLIVDLCEETLDKHVQSKNINYLRKHGPRMAKEMLTGLEFLHDHGILHRDLKPSNVLVDVDGHMKLADFGISRVLNEDETTVHTDTKGTEGWKAAEVIDNLNRENRGRFKKKSGIQSAGMITFFILTKGKHPFGSTLYDRMTNIVNENPVNLNQLDDFDSRQFVSCLIRRKIEDRPYAHEALLQPFMDDLTPEGSSRTKRVLQLL